MKIFIAAFLFLFYAGVSGATGKNNTTNNYTTNNHYTNNPPPETTIVSGYGSGDLAEAVTAAMAMGGHQFYNTFNWQGSLVGVWGDDENGLSVALAKKWKNHPNLLLHSAYTETNSKSYLMVGGTFEF